MFLEINKVWCPEYFEKLKLTYRILQILVEDFAVTSIHVGHVDGVSICPIDFPLWESTKKIVVFELCTEYHIVETLIHSVYIHCSLQGGENERVKILW